MNFFALKKTCNTSYPLLFSFNRLVLVQMSYYLLSAFPDTSIFFASLPLSFLFSSTFFVIIYFLV